MAKFSVTADVSNLKVQKDEHVQIGKHYFHFLNADNRELNGAATFTIVDKQYTSAKDHKKYSAMSKKECVKTGKSSNCCTDDNLAENTRIYHVII